jgi:hypothetical protein
MGPGMYSQPEDHQSYTDALPDEMRALALEVTK